MVLGTSRRRFERMAQLLSEALCSHTCQSVWRRDALRKPDISTRYLVWAIEPGAMKTQRRFRPVYPYRRGPGMRLLLSRAVSMNQRTT